MQYDGIPAAAQNFDELPASALVPVKVVAIIRGESVATVWRRVRQGRLNPIHIGPNSTRFQVGEVRESLKGNQP